MSHITPVTFSRGSVAISGEVFGDPEAVCLVSLHGGHPTITRSSAPLLDYLWQKHGISSLRFDHIGCGKSGGTLEKTSLSSRINDVLTVVSQLGVKDIALIGSSMGGYVAARVSAEIPVQKLVLIVPAAYAPETEGLLFGQPFRQAIREPESWRRSRISQILSQYNGRSMLIRAGQDKVIPNGVYDVYQSRVDVVIHQPAAGHKVFGWWEENLQEKEPVYADIAKFLKN